MVGSGYPWSDNFQLRLLALLVKEPKRTFGIVEPAFFTNPILTDIAKVVKDCLKNHNLETVELSKATLKELVKAHHGKNRETWQPYRRMIRRVYNVGLRDKEILFTQALEFAKESKYRDAVIKSEQDVNAHKYETIHKRLDEARMFGRDPDLGVDYWKDIGDKQRWRLTRLGRVPTRFKKLDRAMGGGPGAGELAIVLAGGKVGKTTALANIAAGGMWGGFNVALATGELSEEKYRLRIDALMTKTPSLDILRFKAIRREVRKKLRGLKRVVRGDLRIKQYPSGGASTLDIAAWLDELEQVEEFETDLLIVDYLFLFNSSQKYKDRRTAIGQTAVELRGIGVTKGIPVWTASQGNRAALSKSIIGPKDFAEDISQFWTLDFLIALCQDDQESGFTPQRARIYVASARDVAHSDVIKITIDRASSKIVESDWKMSKKKKGSEFDVEPEDKDDD